jgi:predicted Fe-S protein YdhL (DUF1289 family)
VQSLGNRTQVDSVSCLFFENAGTLFSKRSVLGDTSKNRCLRYRALQGGRQVFLGFGCGGACVDLRCRGCDSTVDERFSWNQSAHKLFHNVTSLFGLQSFENSRRRFRGEKWVGEIRLWGNLLLEVQFTQRVFVDWPFTALALFATRDCIAYFSKRKSNLFAHLSTKTIGSICLLFIRIGLCISHRDSFRTDEKSLLRIANTSRAQMQMRLIKFLDLRRWNLAEIFLRLKSCFTNSFYQFLLFLHFISFEKCFEKNQVCSNWNWDSLISDTSHWANMKYLICRREIHPQRGKDELHAYSNRIPSRIPKIEQLCRKSGWVTKISKRTIRTCHRLRSARSTPKGFNLQRRIKSETLPQMNEEEWDGKLDTPRCRRRTLCKVLCWARISSSATVGSSVITAVVIF